MNADDNAKMDVFEYEPTENGLRVRHKPCGAELVLGRGESREWVCGCPGSKPLQHHAGVRGGSYSVWEA